MAIDGIFSNPLFGAPKGGQESQAATGFTQVFASMVAQQLREAMVGADQGPLGIAGGASGDIYGAFLDQALGHALADSPAMKPLNQAIERELGGTHSQALNAQKADAAVATEAAISNTGLSQNGTDAALPSDSRGPLLLPPAPATVASLLPPPPSLEG